jgi:hypothetical protein
LIYPRTYSGAKSIGSVGRIGCELGLLVGYSGFSFLITIS